MARFRWPRATLRTYMVAVILVATVPLALLMSFRIVVQEQREREVLLAHLEGTAKAVAMGVDRELVASVDTLRALAQSEALQRADLDAFERHLRWRGPLRPSWDRIALLRADGTLLFEVERDGRKPVAPSAAPEVAALARAWQDQRATGEALLGMAEGDAAPRWTWVGADTATPDGTRYLLAARIGLGVWQSLLELATPASGGYATLFDARRRVLARTLAPERFAGTALPSATVVAMGAERAGVHKVGLLGGGAETYVAWQMLGQGKQGQGQQGQGQVEQSQGESGRGDWGVGVGVPAAPFDDAQKRDMLVTLFAAAACLLLGVTAATMVAQRVSRPLGRLMRYRDAGDAGGAGGGRNGRTGGNGRGGDKGHEDRDGKGDGKSGASAEEPIEVTEIAQLRDAFERSERARDEASARLAKKAEEFETLFRICPTGLAFAQDPACAHVLGNPAMNELVPRTGEAAWDGDFEVLHAGRTMPARDYPVVRAARDGETVTATELEIRRPGQAALFMLVSAVPLAGESGRPRGALAAAIDITDRKHAEQERAVLMAREQLARREAEAANRAKDELLSMLGHELRNPLNAIVTSVEVLRRAEPGSPPAVSAREIMARQTRKLASMVDELLDLGQVMADEATLRLRPFDLAALVRARVEAAQTGAAQRRQRLALGTVTTVWVDADADRIGQVLGHLLDNAVKFSPEGGTIEVGLSREGANAMLRVTDDGPGIDPELLSRVFEPFVQGARGLDRTGGGMGVGLALVKRLVELHGGSVATETSAVGTVFEVRLPALESIDVRTGIADSGVHTKIAEIAERAELPSRFATNRRPARPEASASAVSAATTATTAARRIGVIDDNPDALAGMRSMLELAGHFVSTAADGSSGLAMLMADRPDVALVDIGLPGIDGYELVRRSRAAGYRGRMIALSGYGQPHDLKRSIAEGFDAHLVKPLDPERLLPLLQGGSP